MTKKKTAEKKKVMLALQGGGAFGAFTWGVLDRLLEDERIEISAISGTSAGAMNAVAIAHGLAENGNEGARDTLRNLWNSLAYDEAVKKMPYLGAAGSKSNRALAKMFKQLMPETAAGDFMKSLKAVTQGACVRTLLGMAAHEAVKRILLPHAIQIMLTRRLRIMQGQQCVHLIPRP